MVSFKLFGVHVCIHSSLWVMLGALGTYFNYAGTLNVFGVALFVVSGFLSLFLHEMGHALVGLLLGGGKPQIHLNWLGGGSSNEKAVLTRMGGIIMTAAGPFATLLLGAATTVLLMVALGDVGQGARLAGKLTIELQPQVASDILPPMAILFATYLMKMSVWWSALNLLPIFPLDGGLLMFGLMNSPIRMHNISLAAASFLTFAFYMAGFWLLMLIMLMLAIVNYRCLQNMSR